MWGGGNSDEHQGNTIGFKQRSKSSNRFLSLPCLFHPPGVSLDSFFTALSSPYMDCPSDLSLFLIDSYYIYFFLHLICKLLEKDVGSGVMNKWYWLLWAFALLFIYSQFIFLDIFYWVWKISASYPVNHSCNAWMT